MNIPKGSNLASNFEGSKYASKRRNKRTKEEDSTKAHMKYNNCSIINRLFNFLGNALKKTNKNLSEVDFSMIK